MKNLFRIITAIAFTLGILHCSAQTLTPKPFPHKVGFYPYYEYKPDSAKYLLFFVHGHGERGNGSLTELPRVLNIGIPKLIKNGNWKRKEFIVIAPQYKVTSEYLYPPTFHSFIKSACSFYGIDSTKVFLVGISGGGISVNKYISQYHHVNACLSISGRFDLFNVKIAKEITKTRLWVVHGLDDTTIPTASAENFIRAYNLSYPEYPARYDPIINYAHEPGVWDRACSKDKYFNWMLKP